jgi:hypothetical protein
MVEHEGFEHIDTDSLAGHPFTALEHLWVEVVRRGAPAESLVSAVLAYPRAVVIEFGLWATPDNIGLMRDLKSSGASTWWLDGDREAAFQAWRNENVRSGRPFSEALWAEVVSVIDTNWALLEELYGSAILRTVEAGPVHAPLEATFAAMLAAER